jgi:primary-amine oxidase
LLDPSRNLNLTSPLNATYTDNYVYSIEKLHTNKTDVLNYIDNGGTPPNNYSRVLIVQNGQTDPVVQEYIVGPIPISESTTITPLDYIYHRPGTTPFNAGVWDKPRTALYDKKINEIMCQILDITLDLTGYVYCNDDSNMTYIPTAPFSRNGSRTILWVVFQQVNNNYWTDDTSAATILQLPIILGLDVSGTDPSLHKLLLLVYNTQYFSTLDDFINAYKEKSLILAPKSNSDTSWTSPKRNDSVPIRPLADIPFPSVNNQKRYTVSDNNLVEWMDWSFFIAYSRDLGITLYDIKFKGERIIYELGLQEAVTHYAGNDPYTASTAYLDRYIGIGEFQFQLVEGYDVPFNSTLIDIIYHKIGYTVTQKKAIAIFEYDSATPLQHHVSNDIEELEYHWNWISSVKSPLLVVRGISTLGNYDFMFDYIFSLDYYRSEIFSIWIFTSNVLYHFTKCLWISCPRYPKRWHSYSFFQL